MATGIPWPTRQVFPLSRGKLIHLGLIATGVARFPTDSIGTFSLTLTNLVVGSSVYIETQANVFIEFRVADSNIEVFNIPAYPVGNPANELNIKVRKSSSSPYYKAYDTLTTAYVGSQSIYVSQILDE